jgi:hypothetical protein
VTDTTNFKITRGDTVTFQFDSKEWDGTASDLTTYTAVWFTIKRSKLDTDIQALVLKQLGAGVTIDPSLSSRAHIRIESADTNALTVAGDSLDLYYDLQTRDGAGDIHTPQLGILTVATDITRAN